jgi:hypothetical protein
MKTKKYLTLCLIIWALTMATVNAVTFHSTNWLETSTSGAVMEKSMSFNVWIPDTPDVEIKGVLFWWHGSTYWPNNWSENPNSIVQRLRQTATALDFAIIHRKETQYPPVTCFPDETVNAFQKILQVAAEVSGHPELTTVPQMHTGFSGGGVQCHSYPHLISERVIAAASIQGVRGGYWGNGCSTEQLVAESLDSVPIIFLAGRLDGNVPANSIEDIFDEERPFGSPVAFAAYPVQHAIYVPFMEMGLYYMTETYRKRLELAGGYPGPTNGLVRLPEIPLTNGWLVQSEDFSGNNVSTNAYAFPESAPYNAYTGDVVNASWLPTEGAAMAYRAFAATDGETNSWVNDGFKNGPLAITNLVAFTVYTNGQTISIGIDPRTFDGFRTIEQMNLYLDDTVVGTDTNSPWEFNIALTNAWRGLHALTAVAEGDDGEKTSCFRVIVVNDEP